jgi:hypothetical protein
MEGFLNHIPIAGTGNRDASASTARVCNGFSRLLLILAAVELVTGPLTQQLWTWDHLLHGGQDFESFLLVAVISLCLVLLLAQHKKDHLARLKHPIGQLAAIRRLFRFISPDRELAGRIQDRKRSVLLAERFAARGLSLNFLPLQI